MSESIFFFFDSGTIYNGSHRYYMDTLFSPKVKYRISTVNHSKKFTDPVPDPDPDSDSGENCLSVCRSDYYIVTCSMRSAVGIKKSYIELFTDSRLFWGGKTRIRNWFFKKNSSTQMSLSGGPTTTLALWIFTKKKVFTLNIPSLDISLRSLQFNRDNSTYPSLHSLRLDLCPPKLPLPQTL
jgi:hypothetical protein